ncbi:hypothetical protein [Aquimarina sp. 2201CG5-10]|uniref:hypothetical protein n=1 Tax=Aquimarina callyspongiae TaxID=3098150 RepID=UPI002AB3AF4F|nr:hypothetical protein [Aquimarina sp. 2201CG5-10]MDY8135359.1 hypothetical protein [Aquimarina sp. 2201CG5-10]
MKKILNLTGVQKLSKDEQQQIKGAAFRATCCPSGRGCLISFGGQSFCEPGFCDRWGRCIFF